MALQINSAPTVIANNKLCGSARPSPPSVGAEAPRAAEPDRNETVDSHGEYVPMATAAAARCINPE